MLGFINFYEDQFNYYPNNHIHTERRSSESNSDDDTPLNDLISSKNDIYYAKKSLKRFEESQNLGSESSTDVQNADHVVFVKTVRKGRAGRAGNN